MKKWMFPGLMVLIILIAGCSNGDGHQEGRHMAGPPSQEALQSLGKAAKQVDVAPPSFVSTKPKEVRHLYKLAYAHRDVLKYMPCFCGCTNQGHESNKDCFIRDVRENGAVVWDKMAAG